LPRADLPRGGVWVVTGGARGITAASALALGRRYGWKLHLVGRSPAPRDDAPWRKFSDAEMKTFKTSIVRAAVAEGRSPEEDWMRIKKDVEIYDTLAQFRQAGVQFAYHSCDISDWEALGKTLDAIRAADGPIEGILHGAGYAKPSRFEQKNRAAVERTVAAKVDGAVALMALTERDPLRWFVGFGSLSGRFGGNGLSDYAAANDMLAKLLAALRRRRPQCAAACIHWQTWDEVGMATLADGVAITKNVLQMAFIPPQEGIEHLHQELRAGLPAAEIVVTDGHFQRTFYPDQAPSVAEAGSAAQGPGPIAQATPAATGRPLVESVVRREDGGWVVGLRLDPTNDPFLREHRLRNKPFLPGVIGWEALAEAASLGSQGRTVVALRDVEIANGMLFHGPEPMEAEVTVAAADGGLACALTSRQCDRKGRLIAAQRLHVRAIAELSDVPATIESPPPGQPPLGWVANQYAENGLLYHGAPFRWLKQWAFQYDGGWGQIVAPSLADLAGPRPAAGWILPPAVLDACLYACGGFVFVQFGGQVEAPHGMERLVWTRQPKEGETCILRFFFRGRDQHYSRYDFTLFGEDQRPLLQATGFRMVRVVPGG
jgi:NAD(P)-dependent dehydrogenase (short-subunit alcohol dehydrogenase family)